MKGYQILKILVGLILIPAALASTDVHGASVQEDSVLVFKGTIYSKLTKEPVQQATIFYEKLPHFDDMGLANANIHTGEFELNLVEGAMYMVKISAEGFETFQEEMTVLVSESEDVNHREFYLSPDRIHQIISLNNLNFARQQSVISSESFDELNILSDWLIKKPGIVIQLEGHTDFAGGSKANMSLSEDRVNAVKKYMVRRGARRSQIKTKAFGGTKPLTMERSAEARSMNRRVEVRVLKQ